MSRKEWPELVGMPAEEASAAIRGDSPDVTEVHVVGQGQMVTMDFRPGRVRLYVDDQGRVSRVPSTG
ncbi:serine protease inhibitor [Streptomyces sp. cmx-4-9]|uniref:serine protease inhibitor n=1 Tax=Streptomyces sp. cmx-4-9 TaxID=2790941 RepID=UPI00398083A9